MANRQEEQLLAFARRMGKQEGEARGRFDGYLRGIKVWTLPDSYECWQQIENAYQEAKSDAYKVALQDGEKEGNVDAELQKGGE